MKEFSMYFLKSEYYNIIRSVGGQWNDSKERPIVCLLRVDDSDIYFAIPVGNWEHRDEKAKLRILSYINADSKKLSSNFYHIGNTTVKSIFFISDAIPITDKYIDRDYLGYDNKGYCILNKKLQAELIKKLKRILRQENLHPNYFRQHITDVKKYLLSK
ncbi:MAG: hypothetical protein K6B38_15350 [Ruminococcus sp.]|nr:hypothetical protein [Ruminococcus sp.]